MLPTLAHPSQARQHPSDAELRAARAYARAALRGLDQQRAILPDDAPLVRAASRAPRGHAILPRWHQEDRGWANRHRGHHQPAPEGAYARIPVWHGRAHWLGIVIPFALADDDYRRARGHTHQRPRIDIDTFKLWAEIESNYVQHRRTGRRLVVRPSTVAQVMGVSERTVQRCRAYARRLGLLVDVSPGRMLTAGESLACRRRGSRQRGLSTESALSIPRRLRLPVDRVTPTSGRASRPPNLTLDSPTDSAASGTATKEAASRPPQPTRRRPAPVVQLARSVQDRIPWLQHEKVASLVPSLHRFATGERPWTAQDLIDGIDTITVRCGYTAVRAERIRTRPAAVLAWFLRELDPINDHPRAGFNDAAAGGRTTWPTWCGHCDNHTRQRWEPADALAYRCPICHPLNS